MPRNIHCMVTPEQSNEGSDNDDVPLATPPAGDAKPLAVSIKRFCELTSLGRTTAFQLARDGRIEVRRVGSRTLILMRSVEALLGLDSREER